MSGAREPFATVVLPTRDRPELLSRALASVAGQSLAAWEAIVVDDGDGRGAAVAVTPGDARIRALPNPGRGLADARNAAIVHAAGTYVCWLDDDDWWDDPQHLAVLHTGAAGGDALFHRGGYIVQEDGRREPFDWPTTPESLRRDNTVLTSSIAYPRRWHRRIGLLDASLGGYCDWDVLLRLLDAGLPLRTLPGRGVCYALHATNASSDPARAERVARFERLCSKHGLDAMIHSHATLHEQLGATRLAAPG